MTAERKQGKRYPVSAAIMRVVIGYAELLPDGRYSATYDGRSKAEKVPLPGTFATIRDAVEAIRECHSKSCEIEMDRREREAAR